MLTPAGQAWLRGGHGPLHTNEVSTGLRGGWSHREGFASYTRTGLCIPLHREAGHATRPGQSGGTGVCRKGLQESLLFLLFFRKEGVRNFFFFLDGDLPGDPSLPGSSAAGEVASSAAWAGAGSGLAARGDLVGDPGGLGGPLASPSPSSSSFSNVGKLSTSEGSSGDRSGRVGLKVAASLSSPEGGSRGRSGGWGRRDAVTERPPRSPGLPRALHRHCPEVSLKQSEELSARPTLRQGWTQLTE